MINPGEKYQAALNDHKHYDNLSLAVVTGMIITAVGAFSVSTNMGESIPHYLVFLAAIGVMLSLMFLYNSLSKYAGIARKVAANIERNAANLKGVSEVYDDMNLQKAYKPTKGPIYIAVLMLNIFLCVCLGLTAILGRG